MKRLIAKLNSLNVDGRWFLFSSHFILISTGILFYHLQRSPFQIISCLVAAVACEFIGSLYLGKFTTFKLLDRGVSAFSLGLGLLVLIHSQRPYYYALAAFVAVFSKYILRRPDGKHIYNPTNFAIIFLYLLLPMDQFSLYADEFSVRFWPYFSVPLLGLCAVYFSGRWPISLAYAAANIVLAAIVAPFFHMAFYYVVAPDIGLIGLIFLFLMITDPQTSPPTKKGMMAFGAAVACVNVLLRFCEISFSYFVALYIVTSLRQLSWLLPLMVRKTTKPTEIQIPQSESKAS